MSTTHTPHPIPSTGASQCDLILDALRRAPGWVTMLDLHRASGSHAVHSRIADLRARGHEIAQWSDQVRNPVTGRVQCRSHYRLTKDASPS